MRIFHHLIITAVIAIATLIPASTAAIGLLPSGNWGHEDIEQENVVDGAGKYWAVSVTRNTSRICGTNLNDYIVLYRVVPATFSPTTLRIDSGNTTIDGLMNPFVNNALVYSEGSIQACFSAVEVARARLTAQDLRETYIWIDNGRSGEGQFQTVLLNMFSQR